MPRMNIYVPDEMKARMDATGDDANWSGVAQRAFDADLRHRENAKEIASMSDVIDRLRASREEYYLLGHERGRDAGTAWAKEKAEFTELRELAKITGVTTEDGKDAAYEVLVKIDPRHAEMPLDWVLSFFGTEDDQESLTYQYVYGFVEGAQRVWNEVKDRI